VSQSKYDPDPKFIKRFTVRIQSKSAEMHYSSESVLSKTSSMVIYVPRTIYAWPCRPIVRQVMSG